MAVLPNAGPVGLVQGTGPFYPTPDMFSDQGQQTNKILSPFGLQMPAAPDPNASLFHFNPMSFMGQHPGIRLPFENAIAGMALTPEAPLVSGAGSGMTRMAQGLLGVPELRRQRMLEQFMGPFNLANVMAGIQEKMAYVPFAQAYGQYMLGRNQATTDAAAIRGDASRYNSDNRLQGVQETNDSRETIAGMRGPMGAGGGLVGTIFALQHSQDPKMRQAGKELEQLAVRLTGEKTTANENAKAPFKADANIGKSSERYFNELLSKLSNKGAISNARANLMFQLRREPTDREVNQAVAGVPLTAEELTRAYNDWKTAYNPDDPYDFGRYLTGWVQGQSANSPMGGGTSNASNPAGLEFPK